MANYHIQKHACHKCALSAIETILEPLVPDGELTRSQIPAERLKAATKKMWPEKRCDIKKTIQMHSKKNILKITNHDPQKLLARCWLDPNPAARCRPQAFFTT